MGAAHHFPVHYDITHFLYSYTVALASSNETPQQNTHRGMTTVTPASGVACCSIIDMLMSR
jgi:hypothetical protein